MPIAKKTTAKKTDAAPTSGLSDARFRANVEALSALVPSHSARVRMLDHIIAGRDYLAEHVAQGRPVPGEEPEPTAPSSGPPAGMKTTQTVKS